MVVGSDCLDLGWDSGGRAGGFRPPSCARRPRDHAHDVGLLHDQEILAIDLDLGSRPFAEEHGVANHQVDGNELAFVIASAGPNSDDLSLLRLFLDGIRYNNTAL